MFVTDWVYSKEGYPSHTTQSESTGHPTDQSQPTLRRPTTQSEPRFLATSQSSPSQVTRFCLVLHVSQSSGHVSHCTSLMFFRLMPGWDYSCASSSSSSFSSLPASLLTFNCVRDDQGTGFTTHLFKLFRVVYCERCCKKERVAVITRLLV